MATTVFRVDVSSTEKGVANGVATLDGNGLVPSNQLPSYVDDVQEYSSTSAFPASGEIGKIYVATDTNKSYRWSGSTYIELSAYALASQAAAGLMSATDKTKLDGVDTGANKTTIVNNLTTTAEGYALDARRGKALSDQIGDVNNLSTTAKTAVGGINELFNRFDRYYGALSNIKKSGIYYCLEVTDGYEPYSQIYHCIHIGTTSYCMQIAANIWDSTSLYYRKCINGTWGSWIQLHS